MRFAASTMVISRSSGWTKSRIGPRTELFGGEAESSLPGGVQVLEVPIERRRPDQVEGERVVPLEPGLQGASLVDEAPEQATDGEVGAGRGQEGREAELLGDDRFVDDQQRERHDCHRQAASLPELHRCDRNRDRPDHPDHARRLVISQAENEDRGQRGHRTQNDHPTQ